MNEQMKKLVDLRVKLQLAETRYDEATDEKEVESLEGEITDLKEEISKVEAEIEEEDKAKEEKQDEENKAKEEKKEEEKTEPTSEEVQRSNEWTKVNPENVKKVFSQENRGGKKMEKNIEQRKAFMDAIYSGNLSKLEKRTDAYTTTGDVQYVIPENLVNDIITEIEERGYILNKVTKTNFAVGQTIPVGLIQIKATWVGDTETGVGKNNTGEGLGSDVQKGGVKATVTFLNYKLRCEIGLTHEASIQSLPVFEKKFIEQVANAMVEAIETAIISGSGVNQPKGVLLETPRDGKALEIPANTKFTYKDLVKFVGAVPKKYRKGALIYCTQNTFYEWMSIVDDNGQPVAKVNYGTDGEIRQYLFNTEVIFADEYMNDYVASPTADTKFAFIYNFSEYTLNTNYDLGIATRQNWDNENHELKAVLACDGKAVTKYSLVTWTVKKASSPSA